MTAKQPAGKVSKEHLSNVERLAAESRKARSVLRAQADKLPPKDREDSPDPMPGKGSKA